MKLKCDKCSIQTLPVYMELKATDGDYAYFQCPRCMDTKKKLARTIEEIK